jgi:hypothetical protein
MWVRSSLPGRWRGVFRKAVGGENGRAVDAAIPVSMHALARSAMTKCGVTYHENTAYDSCRVHEAEGIRKNMPKKVRHCARRKKQMNKKARQCTPLVCGEFHAEPEFPHSRAGADGTKPHLSVTRAADKARGVEVKDITWGVESAAGRAKRL